MKFWDASAIIPLIIAEDSTPGLQALALEDSALLVCWASVVECVSALARLERDGAIDNHAMALALERLREFSLGWHEVDPSDEIREVAVRLLRVHPLRAATRCNWPQHLWQLSDGQHRWRSSRSTIALPRRLARKDL